MPTRRITVEEGIAAFTQSNMRPKRGTYVGRMFGQLCGCLIGALAVVHGVDENCISEWAVKEFGDDYLAGVLTGFDGTQYVEPSTRERLLQGIEDGTAVRQAVFNEQGAAQ